MMRVRIAALLLCSLAGGIAGCGIPPEGSPGGPASLPTSPAGPDAALAAHVSAVAAAYRTYGRVDDQRPSWSPTNCRLPSPGRGRFSDSDDDATHGSKLYYLYAKDGDEYRHMSPAAGAVGQALVKEAFAPVATEIDQAPYFVVDDASGMPFAVRDGVTYRPGDAHGLFVMVRVDPSTPGTDDGWIYGTVEPDGTVTGAGRLASCMDCHTEAPHGRLFGLPEK